MEDAARDFGNPGRAPHGTFARIRRAVAQRGDVTDPSALAAWIKRGMYGNPPLLKVESIGPNQMEVTHGDVTALISYSTPVAVKVRTRSGVGVLASEFPIFYRTDKRWSNTTSRHIAAWLRDRGVDPKDVLEVPQADIEKMLTTGRSGVRRNPTLAILGNPRRGAGEPGQGSPLSESATLIEVVTALETMITHASEVYPHFESERGQRDIGAAKVALARAVTLMKQAERGVHRNPRKKIAKRVLAMDYVHAADGKKYTHDFSEDTDHGPVCAYVEDSGRRVVLEASDGRAIVRDY